MTRDRDRFGRAATAVGRFAGLCLLLGLAGCAGLPWMAQEPDDAAALAAVDDYSLGKMHLATGRAGLAVRHFRAAVDRAPESLDALNGLAAAYDSLGRHDLAGRWYARALALDPRSAETLNNIGYSYLLQGHFDLAVAFVREAHRRNGDAPVILENRRAAEVALARAGGPAPRYPVTAASSDPGPPIRPARPRLMRSGRAVQTLITRPQAGAAPPRQILGGHLPGYLRSPLASRLETDARPDASGSGAGSALPRYLASPIRAADLRSMKWRRP